MRLSVVVGGKGEAGARRMGLECKGRFSQEYRGLRVRLGQGWWNAGKSRRGSGFKRRRTSRCGKAEKEMEGS